MEIKKTWKIVLMYILVSLVCGIILGFIGLYNLSVYGGNNCNISYVSSPGNPSELISVGSCDCFCCDMFNQRGYESCGLLGLIIGGLIGVLIGILAVYKLVRK